MVGIVGVGLLVVQQRDRHAVRVGLAVEPPGERGTDAAAAFTRRYEHQHEISNRCRATFSARKPTVSLRYRLRRLCQASLARPVSGCALTARRDESAAWGEYQCRYDKWPLVFSLVLWRGDVTGACHR